MSEIIKHIYEFVFVKTKSISKKIVYLLIIFFILLLVNDYIGFTKNIFINRKLQQLEKLKDLDPVSFQNDSLIVIEISNLKRKILTNESFFRKSGVFFGKVFPKNLFVWRNFSAAIFWILLMILLFVMAFSSEHSFWVTIGILLLAEIWALLMALLYIYLLGLIPEFSSIWINHVINISAQIVTSFLVLYLTGSFKEKNKIV